MKDKYISKYDSTIFFSKQPRVRSIRLRLLMIKINYSNAHEREIIKKRKEITKSVRQVVFRIDCTREKLSGEKITMERNF